MSKLSQLKQEAYQAGKKRNWEQAVSVYERILELDKNNPTIINELGDLCLKAGETQRAVKHFLNAAAKYRTTGLLNNAVAIYKKILRYEAENTNAHWYLAETRASQGLSVEGENHGIHFLDSSGKISGEIKEIFLKRCNQLFELYPTSGQILERLVQIYRTWEMPLEAARAGTLIACRNWDTGAEQEARAAVEDIAAQVPEIQNYPEYAQWLKRTNPDAAPDGAFSDFGSVDLGAEAPAAEPAPAAADEPAPAPAPPPEVRAVVDETPAVEAPAADETSFGDVGPEAAPPQEPAPEPPADTGAGDDAEDGGFIAIDDEGASFDELIAAAEAATDKPAAEAPVAAEPEAAAETPDAADGKVDLLAEILAEDSDPLAGGDSSQLASITSDIGAQLGGDEDEQDPASLYEMGTVYLEMGMHDQACESFSRAVDAGDSNFALRAFEMWGVTLQRAGRFDEAVAVLEQGVTLADEGGAEHLALLYNMGMSYESADRSDDAVAVYERIQAHDPAYLDVARRLSRLTTC